MIPLRVRHLSFKEQKPLEGRVLKLMEEVGELSTEIEKLKGWKKGRHGKTITDAHLEAVDVMIMAMDILVQLGATNDEVDMILASQLDKWENS